MCRSIALKGAGLEELIDGLAAVVKLGCSDELLDQRTLRILTPQDTTCPHCFSLPDG
jgi:hypothetical protein